MMTERTLNIVRLVLALLIAPCASVGGATASWFVALLSGNPEAYFELGLTSFTDMILLWLWLGPLIGLPAHLVLVRGGLTRLWIYLLLYAGLAPLAAGAWLVWTGGEAGAGGPWLVSLFFAIQALQGLCVGLVFWVVAVWRNPVLIGNDET